MKPSQANELEIEDECSFDEDEGRDQDFRRSNQDLASLQLTEKLKCIAFRYGISDGAIASMALSVLEDIDLNAVFYLSCWHVFCKPNL